MIAKAQPSYDTLFKRAVRDAKKYLRDYSKDAYEYHSYLTCGVHKRVAERFLNTRDDAIPEPDQYKSIIKAVLQEEGWTE